MPRINLNVVIVGGNSTVDTNMFAKRITASYAPTVQV
jgi:hypothetical protein